MLPVSGVTGGRKNVSQPQQGGPAPYYNQGSVGYNYGVHSPTSPVYQASPTSSYSSPISHPPSKSYLGGSSRDLPNFGSSKKKGNFLGFCRRWLILIVVGLVIVGSGVAGILYYAPMGVEEVKNSVMNIIPNIRMTRQDPDEGVEGDNDEDRDAKMSRDKAVLDHDEVSGGSLMELDDAGHIDVAEEVPQVLNKHFVKWIAGEPMDMQSMTMEILKDIMEENDGMNVQVSDSLPLSRPFAAPIPNICTKTPQEWRNFKTEVLQRPHNSVSIVIPMYNEPLSLLLRTLVTLVERTPHNLLKEVILVDDNSTSPWIKEGGGGYQYQYSGGGWSERLHLNEYLPKFNGLVKMMKASDGASSIGSTMSKHAGLMKATGDIVVFVDAHVEFDFRWSEILVERITQDNRVVVVPRTHQLVPESMSVSSAIVEPPVGFYWKLLETSMLTGMELEAFTKSPMIGAGMFGVHRRTFLEEFGGFDTDMPGKYGLDMLELSIRIWMAGGSIEYSACSNIEHVFRRQTTPKELLRGEMSPTYEIYLNKLRTMVLWFPHPYNLWIYNLLGNPTDIKIEELGELKTRRRWIKSTRGNRNMKWFLEHVFPDALLADPSSVKILRTIKNEASGMCLHQGKGRHMPGNSPVSLVPCPDMKMVLSDKEKHSKHNNAHVEKASLFTLMHPLHQYTFLYDTNQQILMSGTNDEAGICNATSCEISVAMNPSNRSQIGSHLQMKTLTDPSKEYIQYTPDQDMLTDQKVVFVHPSGYCVSYSSESSSPVLRHCDLQDKKQIWLVSRIHSSGWLDELEKKLSQN